MATMTSDARSIPAWHAEPVEAATSLAPARTADVKGMTSGTQLHFHVIDADGRLILHFAGAGTRGPPAVTHHALARGPLKPRLFQ